MAEGVEFKDERLLVTDEQLVDWRVTERTDSGRPRAVGGPCPSCGHDTSAPLALQVLGIRPSVEDDPMPSPRKRITRVIECECSQSHPQPGAAEGQESSSQPVEMSCGRWWLASIAISEGVGQEVRAGDGSLLTAAEAVRDALASEETRVRDSAENWIKGVAALLGLFGLSGVVVGREAVAGLPQPWGVVAAVAVGVALVAAGVAVGFSYRAAYGWPGAIDIGDDAKLRAWFEGRRERFSAAASHLRRGVVLACVALAALAIAVGVVWFAPREAPRPLVRVTLEDESFVCGHLLSTARDGTVGVRAPTGAVAALALTAVERVDVVRTCP